MSFWPRGFSRNPRMPKLRCKSALITAVPLQSNPELTLPTCMKPYLSALIGPCKVRAKLSMESCTSSARPLPSRCMRTAFHLFDFQEGFIAILLALKAMPAWISGSPAPLVFTAKHKNTSKDPWPYVCEVDKHRPICSPHWQHRLGKQRFRTIRTSLYVKKTLMNICECLCTRAPIYKKKRFSKCEPRQSNVPFVQSR